MKEQKLDWKDLKKVVEIARIWFMNETHLSTEQSNVLGKSISNVQKYEHYLKRMECDEVCE